MLQGKDEIDQKRPLTWVVKGSDKDPEMYQSDCISAMHRLPESRHGETTEHAEHELNAASKME